MGFVPYQFPAEGFISVEDYARKKGITKIAMYEKIKAGKLEGCYVRDQRDRINLDEAKCDEALSHPSVREQMNQKTIKDAESPDNEQHQAKGYQKARTGNEMIKFELARLELEEKKGSLVSADKVKKEQFLFARSIRDQLLNIPDRISALLAAEFDERSCHKMLLDQIRDALKATEQFMIGAPDRD